MWGQAIADPMPRGSSYLIYLRLTGVCYPALEVVGSGGGGYESSGESEST